MGRIRVGKPDVQPDTPGHVCGVRQGNEGPCRRQRGCHKDGTADSRRATGVRWRKHNAILESMPNVPPG